MHLHRIHDVEIRHTRNSIEAHCGTCVEVVSFWVGAPTEYPAALGLTVDELAVHCGEHGQETSFPAIAALIDCREH
jgi:hypothetical protein